MGGYFHEDIVRNILKRLAGEDVIPMKLVSKGWYSLISDPNFIQAHLHHHRLQPPPQLFIQRREFKSGMKDGVSISYNGNQNISTVDDDICPIHIPILPERVWLRAACDGLMLLLDDSGTLYVCNPITRRCSILPPTPSMYPGPYPYKPDAKPPHLNKFIDWILFFDTSAQNYKVFGLSSASKGCVMFTFGGQWSPRIPLEFAQWPLSPPIFFENQLHWVGYNGTEYLICSMDVVTKDIKNRPGPPRPRKFTPYGYSTLFAEVKGRLCLTRVLPTHLDLWFLEGTTPNDHWEKHSTKYAFSNINLVKDAHLCLVSRKGTASDHLLDLLNLFIHHQDKLFYFDFKSLNLKQIAILDHSHKLRQLYHFHFGSLVSWNPSNQLTASPGMQGTPHWKNPLRKCNTNWDKPDSSNCQEIAAKVPRLN